jgi:hypothetical protein
VKDVWRLLNPSCRWNCVEDIPGVWVVIRYAPQNQVESGVRVSCMTVPAVSEVSFRQAEQRRTTLERVNRHGSPSFPQYGQTKPSGQRTASRYVAHAASSGKNFWNCGSDVGKAGLSMSQESQETQVQSTGQAWLLSGHFSFASIEPHFRKRIRSTRRRCHCAGDALHLVYIERAMHSWPEHALKTTADGEKDRMRNVRSPAYDHGYSSYAIT